MTLKILVAVDGSIHSLAAVRCLINQAARYRESPEIELLTVHRPVPSLPRMGMVIGKADIERYYADEGEEALAAAKKLLDRAGVKYRSNVLIGDPGDLIAKRASEGGFDLLFVGTPAKWIGSTSYQVINRTEVPVVVVK